MASPPPSPSRLDPWDRTDMGGETKKPFDGSVKRLTADIDEGPLLTTEFNGGGVLDDGGRGRGW